MKRVLIASLAVGLLVAVATMAQVSNPAGAPNGRGRAEVLDRLSPDQKAKATFAFDSPERLHWAFVPLQDTKKKLPLRKGLPHLTS